MALEPPVAICVPAHGDPAGLDLLLNSIDRLDYPRAQLQVIVAVDGPDAGLELCARRHGAEVVVSPHNLGSYAMRNLAVDLLRDASVVLFTDTDCVVRPDWVRAHVSALAEADLSGGAVQFMLDEPPSPAQWVDACRHLRQEHFVNRLGYAATCNLGVRREVIDGIRFDPTLRSGGDFDFGRRTQAAGYVIRYAAGAVIEHPARSSRALLKKMWRVAGGAGQLAASGASATARRDSGRGRAAAAARERGMRVSRLWLVRVALLDYACSMVYAVRVPHVILPAVRRLLRAA